MTSALIERDLINFDTASDLRTPRLGLVLKFSVVGFNDLYA